MTLNYAVPVGMVKLVCYDDRDGLADPRQRRRAPHRRAQLRARHDPAARVERVQGRGHRRRRSWPTAPPSRTGPTRSSASTRSSNRHPVRLGRSGMARRRRRAERGVDDRGVPARRPPGAAARRGSPTCGATARCSVALARKDFQTRYKRTVARRAVGRRRVPARSRAWCWPSCSRGSANSDRRRLRLRRLRAQRDPRVRLRVDLDPGGDDVDRRRRRPHRQGVVPARACSSLVPAPRQPRRRSGSPSSCCSSRCRSSAPRSRPQLLLLVARGPAPVAFAVGARRSCSSALHVYFRDVKFLVQAALLGVALPHADHLPAGDCSDASPAGSTSTR